MYKTFDHFNIDFHHIVGVSNIGMKNLRALLMERKDLSDNVKHLAMLTFSI